MSILDLVRRAVKYASEDRMTTTRNTRLRRVLDEMEAWTNQEQARAPDLADWVAAACRSRLGAPVAVDFCRDRDETYASVHLSNGAILVRVVMGEKPSHRNEVSHALVWPRPSYHCDRYDTAAGLRMALDALAGGI